MIDWTTVLLDVGITPDTYKDEFSIKCPFHVDKVDSCSINVEKGVWICFAGCGSGSLKTFLQKYLSYSKIQIDNLLREQEATFNIDLFDEYRIDEDDELPTVDFPFDKSSVPKWVLERGFNKDTLVKWGCAINTYNDLIIPVDDANKRMIGWVSRRLNAVPKYMYSKGLKKSKILFGDCHLVKKPFVCITEGSLDTMWLDQHGFGSIALLGSSMSKKQREMLYNISTKEFVVCLDNDSTGQRALNKIFKELSNSFIVSYITLPKGFKDVQDVRNENQLCDIIDKRNYW
jgi:DNA primase|tara:strand:- start:808 stop:1671 length:864 start_codon:yes stop_codon:yes gene_type:complete